MAKLRALLVGVTHYDYDLWEGDVPGAGESKRKNMFSAGYDVQAMKDLIKSMVGNGKPFEEVEVMCLRTGDATTRDMILDHGLPWLFRPPATKTLDLATKKVVVPDFDGKDWEWPKLLLYFSGHGMRVRVPNAQGQKYWDEVLCPSDTDWNTQPDAPEKKYITDQDILNRGYDALSSGAWLEVVLETCSSGGVFGPSQSDRIGDPKSTLRFGCLFHETKSAAALPFPKGAGAVWSAAKADQHSHSGRLDVCSTDDKEDPVRGLFTKFLCDHVPGGKPRIGVLGNVDVNLGAYIGAFNSCTCCKKAKPMELQTPGLLGGPVVEQGFPFRGESKRNVLDAAYTPRRELLSLGTLPLEELKLTYKDGKEHRLYQFPPNPLTFPKIGVCLPGG